MNIAFDRYAWKLRNALAEITLNVKTGGVYLDPANPDSCCSTLSYRSTRAVLEFLDLGPRDVFVDVGCGKGRVLCCAAQAPIRRVMGIEMNPEAACAARSNAARMRGRKAPIEVLEGDARLASYHDATVLYLFNPFGADVLATVLDRIRETRTRDRRPLRVAYTYPRQAQVLEQCGWLEKYAEWPERRELGVPHSTQFWRTS
jgi:cyclopropane fatty-acyl-phospholipid synthase-like methyltransferase